jgi:hypothetical protein
MESDCYILVFRENVGESLLAAYSVIYTNLLSLFFSSLITLYHLVRHTRWFFECYSKLIQKLPL